MIFLESCGASAIPWHLESIPGRRAPARHRRFPGVRQANPQRQGTTPRIPSWPVRPESGGHCELPGLVRERSAPAPEDSHYWHRAGSDRAGTARYSLMISLRSGAHASRSARTLARLLPSFSVAANSTPAPDTAGRSYPPAGSGSSCSRPVPVRLHSTEAMHRRPDRSGTFPFVRHNRPAPLRCHEERVMAAGTGRSNVETNTELRRARAEPIQHVVDAAAIQQDIPNDRRSASATNRRASRKLLLPDPLGPTRTDSGGGRTSHAAILR